jgi:hypothetical protein
MFKTKKKRKKYLIRDQNILYPNFAREGLFIFLDLSKLVGPTFQLTKTIRTILLNIKLIISFSAYLSHSQAFFVMKEKISLSQTKTLLCCWLFQTRVSIKASFRKNRRFQQVIKIKSINYLPLVTQKARENVYFSWFLGNLA